jgi:pre-mRNA-splicing factor RBM22/SLT11
MSASDEFPLLCEPCLGSNPFVRMLREPLGKNCRICDKPFDAFRWRPPNSALKDTQICKVCARLRHVCQCCILDLQLHVPATVRDAVAEVAELPESAVGRTYQQDLFERSVQLGHTSEAIVPKHAQVHTIANRLAEKGIEAIDIWEKLCPFYVRGSCDRNAQECGLKHQIPEEIVGLTNVQRFPPPPKDKTIKVLYIGNLDLDITEDDLSGVFAKFGPVESLRIIPKKLIGFVDYAHRNDAEAAVRYLWGNLIVKGQQIRVNWAKSSTPYGVAKKEEAVAGQKRKAQDEPKKKETIASVIAPPSQQNNATKAAPSRLPPGIKIQPEKKEIQEEESNKKPKMIIKTKDVNLL